MNLTRLIWKEVLFNKATTLLMLLAVTGAAAYAAATVTLLQSQHLQLEQRVKAMDDEIRKITKDMGFNINILPKNQNLADFYAQDFAEKTMAYDLVQKLADSKEIVTINHLRPALIRKVTWPEVRREVIFMGVHGVVPWTHRTNLKPLAEAVPAGTLVIGYQLAKELDLKEGSTTQLMGREFKIHQVLPARADKDEITVFVDLTAAQEMLELPDQINLIQALECNCASTDRLAEIEQEISRVLGDEVQVVELSTKAIARAKARTQTAEQGQQQLIDAQGRASLYTVLATIAATLFTASMFLLNVHQRQGEIGIFRALGISTGKIMQMFLIKAFLLGLAGAVLGYVLGFLFAWRGQIAPSAGTGLAANELFVPPLLWVIVLLTPIFTVIASWLPALLAAQQQPAEVLSRE